MSSSRQTNGNENNNLLPNKQPNRPKGRVKTSQVKIHVPSHLVVTFSKRKAGALKKASELCTLTGSEVAIVAFSPSNKVHSFGHPNLHTVLSRFINGNSNPLYQEGANNQMRAPYHNPDFLKMNEDITEVEAQLKDLKIRKKDIEKKSTSKYQKEPMSVLDQLHKKELLQLHQNLDVLMQKMDAVNLSKKEANKDHVTGSQDHGTLYSNIGSSSMMNQNNAMFTGGSSTTSFGQDPFQYGNYIYGQFGDHGNGGQSTLTEPVFNSESIVPFTNEQFQSAQAWSSQYAVHGTGASNIPQAPFGEGSSSSLFGQQFHSEASRSFATGASNIPQVPFGEGSSSSLFGQQFHSEASGSFATGASNIHQVPFGEGSSSSLFGQQFRSEVSGSFGTGASNIPQVPFGEGSSSLFGQQFHSDASGSLGHQFNYDAQMSFGQQFHSDTSFGQQFPSDTLFGKQFNSDHAGPGHTQNFRTGVPSPFTANPQPIFGGSSSHYDLPVDGNYVSDVIQSNASNFGGASGSNVSNHHVQQDDDPDFSALYAYLDNSGPKSPNPEFDNIGWTGRYN